jgi:hypothetical protein
LLINFLLSFGRVNSLHSILGLVELHNWNALFLKNSEPLLKHLDVVVIALLVPSCGTSCCDSLNHGLLGALQEEDEAHVSVFTHDLNPTFLVVLISWETVDEELL